MSLSLFWAQLVAEARCCIMSAPVRRPSRDVWAKAYEELRRNLVAAREEAALTQRQAAEKLGRPQSYVAKSESGERRVDVIELVHFAEVYGVAVVDLLPRPRR